MEIPIGVIQGGCRASRCAPVPPGGLTRLKLGTHKSICAPVAQGGTHGSSCVPVVQGVGIHHQGGHFHIVFSLWKPRPSCLSPGTWVAASKHPALLPFL